MEEDIIYEFKNIVEESRTEDRQDYYIKLRNVLDLIQELKEENEQLKVNEEILMKTKGCLNEDNSTNCRVLESLNYGIRAYEKTLKNSIPISVIQNKIMNLNLEIEKLQIEYEKEVVNAYKQVNLGKQTMLSEKVKLLQELLEERE